MSGKRWCLFSGLLSLWFVFVIAAPSQTEAGKQKPQTFKSVMRMLQGNIQQVLQGILMEEYKQIEKAATFIAAHPKPSLRERKRMMRLLGSHKKKFKAIDHQVHGAARRLSRAAKKRDMKEVLRHYQVVLSGCVSCHQLIRPVVRRGQPQMRAPERSFPARR